MDVTKKCPECGKVWCVDCGGSPSTPDCPKCHPKKSKDEIIAEQHREIYALQRRVAELERSER